MPAVPKAAKAESSKAMTSVVRDPHQRPMSLASPHTWSFRSTTHSTLLGGTVTRRDHRAEHRCRQGTSAARALAVAHSAHAVGQTIQRRASWLKAWAGSRSAHCPKRHSRPRILRRRYRRPDRFFGDFDRRRKQDGRNVRHTEIGVAEGVPCLRVQLGDVPVGI